MEEQLKAGEKTIDYKDVALIRYRDDDRVQVVDDYRFSEIFRTRANDDYWKTVLCI